MRWLIHEGALVAFLAVNTAAGWFTQQAAELDTAQRFLLFLREGGLPAFLLIALIGFHRRWWVWGWQYREKARWEKVAWDLIDTQKRLADVVRPGPGEP